MSRSQSKTRIELVRKIVAKTTAQKNARARFCFAYSFDGRNSGNYLELIRRSIGRCPKSANKKGDKDLAVTYYDQTDIAEASAITDAVGDALEERQRTLIETPTALRSSNRAPGLIVADVLAYLTSWDVVSPNPDQTAQAALFETTVGQINATKLKTIREILTLIKRVDVVVP